MPLENLQFKRDFPFPVKVIENDWIPMPDGVRLACKIWVPENASSRPVPAIIEYLPYRKRDKTSLRDALNHPYFAGHGYASLRIDIRGTGDSEGVIKDEYLPTELEDGLEILKWVSGQDWCNGNIGVIGKSWGGFNGLQLAAMKPPQLKAVISLCSTDDRYADDIHYMGGCLLADNLSWSSTMAAYNSLPPDPQIAGENWKKMWLERLEAQYPWITKWMSHQKRDDYWKHGSICENFESFDCPVMAVSGWADGYTNAVFRMVQHLKSPVIGLIGPWGHDFPHMGIPGPCIGFLQECLRWWDQWLKGIDTGILKEPKLRVWMQESTPPSTAYRERPGYWVAENTWPSDNIREEKFYLEKNGILARKNENASITFSIRSPLSVGLFAGRWCSFSSTPDLPYDQREEDGGALVFETEKLTSDIICLGSPQLKMRFSSSKSNAMVAVRLSNVNGIGQVTRITYGLRNLNHLKDHPITHETGEDLESTEDYEATVKLNYIAHVFPKGHKIRIAISTSYWPICWPAPEAFQLELHSNGCEFMLPTRISNHNGEDECVRFEPPESAPPADYEQLEPRDYGWDVYRDLENDKSFLKIKKDEGVIHLNEIDLTMHMQSYEKYGYEKEDFASPSGYARWKRTLERAGFNIKTSGSTHITCNKDKFFVFSTLDAYENGHRIFSNNWKTEIPRDHN